MSWKLLEKSQLYKARALLLGLVFMNNINSELLFTALSVSKLSMFVWGNLHLPCTMIPAKCTSETSTLESRTIVLLSCSEDQNPIWVECLGLCILFSCTP